MGPKQNYQTLFMNKYNAIIMIYDATLAALLHLSAPTKKVVP